LTEREEGIMGEIGRREFCQAGAMLLASPAILLKSKEQVSSKKPEWVAEPLELPEITEIVESICDAPSYSTFAYDHQMHVFWGDGVVERYEWVYSSAPIEYVGEEQVVRYRYYINNVLDIYNIRTLKILRSEKSIILVVPWVGYGKENVCATGRHWDLKVRVTPNEKSEYIFKNFEENFQEKS
jgi:hypothetical protein